MTTRFTHTLFAAAVLALAFLTALTLPAAAQQQTVYVKLPTGEVVQVTVDVPPGSLAGRHPAARHAGSHAHHPDDADQPHGADHAQHSDHAHGARAQAADDTAQRAGAQPAQHGRIAPGSHRQRGADRARRRRRAEHAHRQA